MTYTDYEQSARTATKLLADALAELARVRGLLQRQWISANELWGWYGMLSLLYHRADIRNWGTIGMPSKEEVHAAIGQFEGACKELDKLESNFPQSSSLVPQGAESADIGKLDTAPCISCRENGMPNFGITCARCGSLAGSAETGGEKVAPHPGCPTCGAMLSCASCNWPHYTTDTNGMVIPLPTSPNFRRSFQNQAAAGGVEGAHEGTTADKSGPELLPTQLPKE